MNNNQIDRAYEILDKRRENKISIKDKPYKKGTKTQTNQEYSDLFEGRVLDKGSMKRFKSLERPKKMENEAALEKEESLESFKAKSNLNSPSTSKDQKNRVSHSKLDQIVNKFKNLRKKRPRNSEKPGKLNIKNKRQTSNNNINININISSDQLKGLTETPTVRTPTKSRKLSSLQNNPSSTRFYTSEKISKLFYKDKVSSEHHSNKDSVRSSHKNYPSND